jgi:hypothetical protein
MIMAHALCVSGTDACSCRKLMLERFTLARTGADLAALYERIAPVS